MNITMNRVWFRPLLRRQIIQLFSVIVSASPLACDEASEPPIPPDARAAMLEAFNPPHVRFMQDEAAVLRTPKGYALVIGEKTSLDEGRVEVYYSESGDFIELGTPMFNILFGEVLERFTIDGEEFLVGGISLNYITVQPKIGGAGGVAHVPTTKPSPEEVRRLEFKTPAPAPN